MGTSVHSISGKKSGKDKNKSVVNRIPGAAHTEPDFGVIRHIKKIRRDDSKYNMDPKCVWRFATIEALTDSSGLTQSELHTAKVMSKAKKVLRNSEMHRHGEKRYDGSHINADDAGGYVPPSTTKRRYESKSKASPEEKGKGKGVLKLRTRKSSKKALGWLLRKW